MTVSEVMELAVYGWSDGVLVRFTFRSGRLCEWTRRRCSRTQAAARVAGSPDRWAAFAQRNAQLAAALAAARSLSQS